MLMIRQPRPPFTKTILVNENFAKIKKVYLGNDELKDFVVYKAGLGLNQGPSFGPGGSGFQRLNIGTPRQVLEKAMEKLLKAYKTL